MKFLSAMVQRLGFALALALSIFAGAARAQDKADTTTMIVVDMSGSMLQFMGSSRRYEIAQTMLADVLPDVTEQSNTGLVAFGHRREKLLVSRCHRSTWQQRWGAACQFRQAFRFARSHR